MSLDISLYIKNKCPHCGLEFGDRIEVYDCNITHNLALMADACGIYKELWRPDEIDITKANQLIIPLTEGLKKLKDNPVYYKTFDSSNGWGLYIHFVPFVERYLNACIENPDSEIYVSR